VAVQANNPETSEVCVPSAAGRPIDEVLGKIELGSGTLSVAEYTSKKNISNRATPDKGVLNQSADSHSRAGDSRRIEQDSAEAVFRSTLQVVGCA